MWVRLIILGYEVSIKLYDVASKYGLKGVERISKMEIVKNGQLLVNFDRGHFDVMNMPHWVFEYIIKILAKSYGVATVIIHHTLR